MDPSEAFRMNLKKLRAEAKLSMAELGDKIGVTRQAISNLENTDAAWPSYKTISRLAKALRCEGTDFFKDPNEDKRTNERIEKAKKILNQI